MTYQALLQQTETLLAQGGVREYKEDAWLLYAHAFKVERAQFFLHADEDMKEDCEKEKALLKEYIKSRLQHQPVQYILGYQEFMGYRFVVNDAVLIPRFDTEILVEEALKYTKGRRVLDVCTGSGCIAIVLALLGKAKKVDALDISADALHVARENARIHGCDIHFYESDMFEKVKDCYDCIVSNPPYIPSKEIAGLDREVAQNEPLQALDGGEDGLYFYRKLAHEAGKHLTTGGNLLLEIGWNQGQDVTALLQGEGYTDIQVGKDYAGLDRIICACYHGV